ncbi:MAG: hybrid sensor histidine kinase/response regulator [Bryobacteraceae bacterium]
MEQIPAGSDIMIVDDNPANLKLLEDMLLQKGQEVRSFPLGRLALASAAKNPPDLILLDINMPEMNGYEVCERLKATPELASIPVIILSALNDIQDRVKAFQFGAVDYISKPFQFEEVHARVETHLKLHELQRGLKFQNERLEQAVAERTRELAEANGRLTILDSSKNDFLNLISHEFRTPLNGLLGVAEMILDDLSPTDQNKQLKGVFRRSRRRILSILDDALLLTQIDVTGKHFKCSALPLRRVLWRAMERTAEVAEARHVILGAPQEAAGFILGEEDLLIRALHALLETAVRLSDAGQTVRICCDPIASPRRVLVDVSAKNLPEVAVATFFDLFAISEAITPGSDLGLGPAVAHRILLLFGGSVSLQNLEPTGIRLTISLMESKVDSI